MNNGTTANTLKEAKAMELQSENSSLEAGKRADFFVLDMDKPYPAPAPHPISVVVSASTGKEADIVFIDVKMVVQEGKAQFMGEARILAEARERVERLYRKTGLDLKPRWLVE